MLRQPNNQFYKTVILVWLTLSAASVLIAVVTWVQLSEQLSAARKAITIRAEMDQVLKLLLDVETSTRGFVITGDSELLAPMKAAEATLPASFDKLTELTRDDPALLKRVMDLRGMVELDLSNQRKIIATRRGEGFLPTKALLGNGEAKKLMDEIRAEVSAIHSMRAHLISDEGGKERSQLQRASLTSFGAGILGIGAGLFAFWLARATLKHEERERELVEAKLQAERNSAEKTVFLANVSHEIRTPMNAILGFSELLGNAASEPKQRHYARAIHASAGSLLQLIDDVLDISKIEAGATVLRPEPTDPRKLCEFIRTVFAEITMRKQVKLLCHVAPEMPRALLLDQLRLRQMLVNLVGNAVKFTDHGTVEMQVGFEKQNDGSLVTLLFDIRDTGHGIPKEKLERIFLPFVQVNEARVKDGSGLGLAIVRRLVERMGGTITVTSTLGQGSVFRLRLPDVAVSARLPETQRGKMDALANFDDFCPATFLIVDDNELNRELMAGMFAGSKHRLLFAGDGREAIHKAREAKPDIVLLDIRIPEMDGHEVLRRIRDLPGRELLPVIAVTAASTFEQDPAAKEKFNGFVAKPFSSHQLYEELAHFLPRQTTAEQKAEPVDVTMGDEERSRVAARLQRLARDEWPALCASLGVNEVIAFARRLDAMGTEFSSKALLNYAQKLAGFAEIYDVSGMEDCLLKFPKVVEQFDDVLQEKS